MTRRVALLLPALLSLAATEARGNAPAAYAAPQLTRPSVLAPAPQLPTRDLAPLSSTSWLVGGDVQSYRMPSWTEAPLLERFVNPAVERRHPTDEFWFGRFGRAALKTELKLLWGGGEDTATEGAELQSLELSQLSGSLRESDSDHPGWLSSSRQWFDAQLGGSGRGAWHGPEIFPTWALNQPPAPLGPFASAPLRSPCPAWSPTPRAVSVGSNGAEQDRFVLLECDGSVAPEALDRLSVMARPPGSERPELPLPPEADPAAAERGEWLPGIKLLHPRVLWLLDRLTHAFPGRPIYIVSGYRRDAHSSQHRRARALDLNIQGVPNEDLFKYCRKLRDVGCGYYPNHNFVHVDVRAFGTGHPFWIDVSGPGEPSRYVDGWPGVIESGGLAWAGE